MVRLVNEISIQPSSNTDMIHRQELRKRSPSSSQAEVCHQHKRRRIGSLLEGDNYHPLHRLLPRNPQGDTLDRIVDGQHFLFTENQSLARVLKGPAKNSKTQTSRQSARDGRKRSAGNAANTPRRVQPPRMSKSRNPYVAAPREKKAPARPAKRKQLVVSTESNEELNQPSKRQKKGEQKPRAPAGRRLEPRPLPVGPSPPPTATATPQNPTKSKGSKKAPKPLERLRVDGKLVRRSEISAEDVEAEVARLRGKGKNQQADGLEGAEQAWIEANKARVQLESRSPTQVGCGDGAADDADPGLTAPQPWGPQEAQQRPISLERELQERTGGDKEDCNSIHEPPPGQAPGPEDDATPPEAEPGEESDSEEKFITAPNNSPVSSSGYVTPDEIPHATKASSGQDVSAGPETPAAQTQQEGRSLIEIRDEQGANSEAGGNNDSSSVDSLFGKSPPGSPECPVAAPSPHPQPAPERRTQAIPTLVLPETLASPTSGRSQGGDRDRPRFVLPPGGPVLSTRFQPIFLDAAANAYVFINDVVEYTGGRAREVAKYKDEIDQALRVLAADDGRFCSKAWENFVNGRLRRRNKPLLDIDLVQKIRELTGSSRSPSPERSEEDVAGPKISNPRPTEASFVWDNDSDRWSSEDDFAGPALPPLRMQDMSASRDWSHEDAIADAANAHFYLNGLVDPAGDDQEAMEDLLVMNRRRVIQAIKRIPLGDDGLIARLMEESGVDYYSQVLVPIDDTLRNLPENTNRWPLVGQGALQDFENIVRWKPAANPNRPPVADERGVGVL